MAGGEELQIRLDRDRHMVVASSPVTPPRDVRLAQVFFNHHDRHRQLSLLPHDEDDMSRTGLAHVLPDRSVHAIPVSAGLLSKAPVFSRGDAYSFI